MKNQASTSRPNRRVGIFGGSFDPIHNGHIAVAKMAIKALRLDKLLLMPAAQSPLKESPGASTKQRLEMLKLVLDDIGKAQIDTRELEQPAPSYTIDSLTIINAFEQTPNRDTDLFLIIGTDAWQSFTLWHQWEKILDLAQIAVVNRAADMDRKVLADLNNVPPHANYIPISMPPEPASSSAIRQHITKSEDFSHLVPKEIEQYILKNRLYR